MLIEASKEYALFLNRVKKEIASARLKAHVFINKELILLYWRIGKEILNKQKEQGWGTKVVEQLSLDLKHSFPEMRGLSKRNLSYMRSFAEGFEDDQIVQQAAAQLPWFHLCVIMDKFSDPVLRLWYIEKSIENGWSRNILMMHIEAQAHLKLGKAQTNFALTLPKPTSDLAQEIMKSEYTFDFLGLGPAVEERMIEKGLITHMRDFLLELGRGFAFVGNQYRVTLAGEEFFLDLLMYHIKLKCYVVIELKSGKFKPEYLGKLGFYTTAIDQEVKDDQDNATIGLLLCQVQNKVMVEYCLKDSTKPLSVSEFRTSVPSAYQDLLPTPEELQHFVDTLEEPL